jgi:hypothetical protein
MTGGAWEQFSDAGFADVADNIRAALGGGHEDNLKQRRRMGLAAYEAALAARGTPIGRRAIRNSFLDQLGLDDDDLLWGTKPTRLRSRPRARRAWLKLRAKAESWTPPPLAGFRQSRLVTSNFLTSESLIPAAL